MAITVPVKDQKGKQVSQLTLSETVFGVPMNEAVVWQALVRQRANARQGTASTKTRGEVAGTTRKPWRQKHTGRARVGTRMSPIWRKGGIVFGPKPRDYSQAMPRKMRRLAIRCLLSDKRADGSLEVLKDLKLDQGKTKELLTVFEALKLEGSVLLVTNGSDPASIRSARNLSNVKTMPANLLNAGDLLKYEHLVMTVDAVKRAEEIWSTTKIDRKRAPWAALEAPEPKAEAEPTPEPEPETPPEPEAAPEEAEPMVAEASVPEETVQAEAPAAEPEEAEEKPKPRRRRTTATGRPRTRAARKKADS